MSTATLDDIETESEGIVVDEAELDQNVPPIRYEVTSFGADYDVEGLVRRLEREEIFIPSFQREYVWKMPEASRFIESLLLGLPVPGIFLAREVDTNKLLVVDGQQRLKSLQFFCKGFFNPEADGNSRRVFRLTKVQPQYEGLTYETLPDRDKRQLDGSIIHATIIKQESPRGDDTSIYHIFERLNNGGRRLMPQEIRVASYHGPLLEMLDQLNMYTAWREVYGKKSDRLKDEELILRFLALLLDGEGYDSPMLEFINRFAASHQRASKDFLASCREKFITAIEIIANTLGNQAFRLGGRLNAAVFDSVMVGLSLRLAQNSTAPADGFARAYKSLLEDSEYRQAVSSSTSSVANVKLRLAKAKAAFASLS